MIAVLQRARDAYVTVAEQETGRIDKGLVILLGVCDEDDRTDAEFLADKIAGFRIFSDSDAKMNLSVRDIGGQILVISQFTLCADWRKGRRPSFVHAAEPQKAEYLYEYFTEQLTRHGIPVATGSFGAMMNVHLVNDGPVTFVLDSRADK